AGARRVARLSHAQTRAAARPRDAQSPAGCALRLDVRAWTGGRGAAHSRARLLTRVQAVRIPRIQTGAAAHPGRAQPARCGLLRAAQHAALCQAADHLVSPGARTPMAEGVRRCAPDSPGRACARRRLSFASRLTTRGADSQSAASRLLGTRFR